ncbi:hypothetical protein HYZ78_04610 [Candidatus Microgenomates bacterium]|nr:hypothetical protein [Candidatus Microgenomates bacterium]
MEKTASTNPNDTILQSTLSSPETSGGRTTEATNTSDKLVQTEEKTFQVDRVILTLSIYHETDKSYRLTLNEDFEDPKGEGDGYLKPYALLHSPPPLGLARQKGGKTLYGKLGSGGLRLPRRSEPVEKREIEHTHTNRKSNPTHISEHSHFRRSDRSLCFSIFWDNERLSSDHLTTRRKFPSKLVMKIRSHKNPDNKENNGCNCH